MSFKLSKTRKSLSSSEDSSSDTSTRSSKSSSSSNSYSYSFSSQSSEDEKITFRNNSKNENALNSPESSSTESLTSSSGKLSRANSLNKLEQEYEPKITVNLPFNVYQALCSVKESMINIHNLKKKFLENKEASDNEIIADSMIKESLGCICLTQVIYGSSHWKLAVAFINLAQVYLEFANLPKQAKHHCEKAWTVLVDELKDQSIYEPNTNGSENTKLNPDSNKQQMMLNYIYGRACTLLKQNEEGQSSLEKSMEFYENWKANLSINKINKLEPELMLSEQRINLALAKQYAINNLYEKALIHYDNCIYRIKVSDKNLTKDYFYSDELLIEVYNDKAKIELNRENTWMAVDLVKESLHIAESIESSVLIQECKLNLAKIYANLDDMDSSLQAEKLFKEMIHTHSIISDSVNEKIVKVKDELVKFYLKQERFDDASCLLSTLLREKIELYGDFNLKINSIYKLLCSVHLKQNDMPNAAKYLKRSLELEELNYGKMDKRTVETRETLENLKKNPNVQAKLRTVLNETDTKPAFNVAKKIDYSKTDKNLYSNLNLESLNDSKSLDESTISKKMNPIS